MKQFFLLTFLFISSFSLGQNDFLLAENYYQESEFEKATQIYKKLYEASPFNTTYLNRLISCYQETEQFNIVENLLKSALKENPEQPFLTVFLGYNYERQQQTEIANSYYEIAINAIEKHPNYGEPIANLFKEYNLLDYAIQAYEKAMKNNIRANYSFQIAQIYGEKGAFEKMFQSYVDLLDKNENYLNPIQAYISKYITDDSENKNNILFRKTLLRKSASNPKVVWNVLLSWLFAKQKEYLKAFVQEKALVQRNKSNLSDIFNLGLIAFNHEDFDASKECFDFVLENTLSKEEKLSAILYTIKILIALKSPESESKFLNVFKIYGENKQTLPIQIEYADYLTFEKNAPEKAKKILENSLDFADSKFEKARIKLKLGDILVFTGKFNKALIYFSQIQTELKNDELAQEARFKVAQTSYFKGDFIWAKAQLKILKSSTTQLIANDAVDLFLMITDNEPVDSIPSGLIPYAKAGLLAFQNKNTEAINVLSQLIIEFKGQPIEDEALFKQGKLLIKEQEYKKAITSFEKVIALNPEGILIDDAHYQLAELYNTHLNNQEKASEYYQKIIFDYSSSIYLVDARNKYRKLRGDHLN
jgi:tetratricopeptide (TPR) repeat protein